MGVDAGDVVDAVVVDVVVPPLAGGIGSAGIGGRWRFWHDAPGAQQGSSGRPGVSLPAGGLLTERMIELHCPQTG